MSSKKKPYIYNYINSNKHKTNGAPLNEAKFGYKNPGYILTKTPAGIRISINKGLFQAKGQIWFTESPRIDDQYMLVIGDVPAAKSGASAWGRFNLIGKKSATVEYGLKWIKIHGGEHLFNYISAKEEDELGKMQNAAKRNEIATELGLGPGRISGLNIYFDKAQVGAAHKNGLKLVWLSKKHEPESQYLHDIGWNLEGNANKVIHVEIKGVKIQEKPDFNEKFRIGLSGAAAMNIRDPKVAAWSYLGGDAPQASRPAPITSWPNPDSDDQQAREYNALRAYKLAFDTSRGGQYKTANRGFQKLSPEMQRILQDLRRRDKLQGGIFGVPGIKMDNKEMLQAAMKGDLPSEWLRSSEDMRYRINFIAVRLKYELEKTLPGKESRIIFPYMKRQPSPIMPNQPPKWAAENFRGGQIPAWAEVYYYRLFEAYNNLSGVKGKSNLLSDLLKTTTQNLPMRLGERALITTLTKHNKIFLLDDVWSKDVLGPSENDLAFKFVSTAGVFGTLGNFFRTLLGIGSPLGIGALIVTTIAGAGLAIGRASNLVQQFPDGAPDMAKRRGGVLVKPSEANNQKSIKKIIDNLIGEAKFLVDNGQLGPILNKLRQSLGELHKELRTEQQGKKTSDSKSPEQVKKELVKYIYKLEKKILKYKTI